MPGPVVRELIELSAHDVSVSTGGFIERVLILGSPAVDRYIATCKELGFDTVEVSSGFGARRASHVPELEAQGTRDAAWIIHQARRFLEATDLDVTWGRVVTYKN